MKSDVTGKGEWIDIGLTTQFPENVLTPRTIRGQDLVVVFIDNSYQCYKDECAHQPIPLSDFGKIIGHRIICHAHGAQFDLTCAGKNLCLPALTPLTSFPVEVRGDRLFVFVQN